ncbi:Uncharacterised protein [Vibrio cholerae]|nr:Uncharacterised protein [Vibrio cholerae]
MFIHQLLDFKNSFEVIVIGYQGQGKCFTALHNTTFQ